MEKETCSARVVTLCPIIFSQSDKIGKIQGRSKLFIIVNEVILPIGIMGMIIILIRFCSINAMET